MRLVNVGKLLVTAFLSGSGSPGVARCASPGADRGGVRARDGGTRAGGGEPSRIWLSGSLVLECLRVFK